jgi:hypothetical protein
MSNQWRKEVRYQLLKDGKAVSAWSTKIKAKQKAVELEKLGHKTEIKEIEVEVMPIDLFKEIFG